MMTVTPRKKSLENIRLRNCGYFVIIPLFAFQNVDEVRYRRVGESAVSFNQFRFLNEKLLGLFEIN